MSANGKITLYVDPPGVAETGPAYVRLALGVAHWQPDLLNTYLGPPAWLADVFEKSPDLATLRQHAVAVATAIQHSDLPLNRRERLLRHVRALLWLIRVREQEQIIFSEQVRMLLDVQPESVNEAFIEQAHDTLSAALPGSGPLSERWHDWQTSYTRPATTIWPFLEQAFETWQKQLANEPVLTRDAVSLVKTEGEGPLTYQPGEIHIPRQAGLRVDRLFHLAARWGYGGIHTFHSAAIRRYAAGAGNVECAVLLNLGPEQVLAQGLPLALLAKSDLYRTAIPALLRDAGSPTLDREQLRAIHLAEDALQWIVANAALLLHSEGLRPRAVRRYLMTQALLSPAAAEQMLAGLADPIYAAHVFAPLIGGSLVQAWLERTDHTVAMLLTDPPAPSQMMFAVRFAD